MLFVACKFDDYSNVNDGCFRDVLVIKTWLLHNNDDN